MWTVLFNSGCMYLGEDADAACETYNRYVHVAQQGQDHTAHIIILKDGQGWQEYRHNCLHPLSVLV